MADVPGRHESGTGELDYRRIAQELSNVGYRGTVGLEAFPRSSDEAAIDAFKSAFCEKKQP